ncbi:MAG: hypothetical protein IJK15_08655 [Bacteroidaceae bacterium]|nr:hypothetical protein [Bacteroidaceae bacterium]
MEKKKYSKPVVVAERFEPQEYCATCWCVDGLLTQLYIDKEPKNNQYDRQYNEHISDRSDYLKYFANRLPQDEDEYYKNEPPSQESGTFYTSYTENGWGWNRTYPYVQSSRVSTVYKLSTSIGTLYYQNLHVTGAS